MLTFTTLSARAESLELIAVNPKLQAVVINEKSTIEVKDAYLSTSDLGRIVSFTISFYNGSEEDQYFNNYWVRLNTKSGHSYSTQLLFQDRAHNRILSKTKGEYIFYALIDETTQLSNLVFQFVKWDLKEKGFAKILGTTSLPVDYKLITPLNYKRVIQINNTALKTAVNKMSVSQSGKFNFVQIDFELENRGVNTVKFPDYQFFVKTIDGLMFPLELNEPSGELESIQPRDLKRVELTAMIPITIPIESITLLLSDSVTDSNNKLMLPVALYNVPEVKPEDSSFMTPLLEHKEIQVEDQLVDTSINRVFLQSDDKITNVTLYYQVRNLGEKPITLPDYEYYIRTQLGALYPLISSTVSSTKLLSENFTEFQFKGSIPKQIALDDWDFIVSRKDTEGKNDIPVAMYKLQSPNHFSSSQTRAFEFSGSTGSFKGNINFIRLVPWEDHDILIADLSIANNSSTSLPLPQLSGYYLLNSSIKVDLKVVELNADIELSGQADTGLQLIAEIPMDYKINDLSLMLQEKQASNNALTDLLEIKYEDDITILPVINQADKYVITDKGRKSSLSIYSLQTYEGEEGNVLLVQVKLENLEKRFKNTVPLVGYFKMQDGVLFPVIPVEINKKILPGGKAIVSFWSNLPKDYDLTGVKLILGEGVANNQITSVQGMSDAYIHVNTFILPKPSIVELFNTDFHNISLFPYSLDIHMITMASGGFSNSVSLDFKYKLSKNSQFEINTEGHSLLIEYDDGKAVFSQELSLANGSSNGLKLGTEQSFQIEKNDAELFKRYSFNTYKLNIYDKFQDQKRLIATKTFHWFKTED